LNSSQRHPIKIVPAPQAFVWNAGAPELFANPSPAAKPVEETEAETELDSGYLVICWDDPVNLMEYVTHVFQKVFGWDLAKAEQHMLQVHKNGKSVLVRECFEKAEFYVHQLHKYRLHATLEQGD
jgi:ATP-dependent Clp protease adaptor protein ClpS